MLNRRQFLQQINGALLASCLGIAPASYAKKSARVLIIGGGVAGLTVARLLKQIQPDVQITLLEKNKNYTFGAMSNAVLAGISQLQHIQFNYQKLTAAGINVIFDEAAQVDKDQVETVSGKKHPYDLLLMAPGVQARWTGMEVIGDIPTYCQWSSGTGIDVLSQQVAALKNGGKVIITIPEGMISGPAAPYERACMIADSLQKNGKNKSKIIVAQQPAHNDFSQRFVDIGSKLYPNLLEFRDKQKLQQVNFKTKQLTFAQGKETADLLQVIPPQQAATIAEQSGLTDNSGWCDVAAHTFLSKKNDKVYILGDAINHPLGLRKTAQCARSQAIICALAMSDKLSGKSFNGELPPILDVEYSLLKTDYAISHVDTYPWDATAQRFIESKTTTTDTLATAEAARRTFAYAQSWFNNLSYELFSS